MVTILNIYFIAWKAGRLKIDENGEYKWDGKNGMGNTIVNIDKYLKEINNQRSVICCWLAQGDVQSAYQKLLDLNVQCGVKQFGTVYIITLIYFLSKGKYPIYDKFAHKAIMAIDSNRNPMDITVASPPDKSSVAKVINMYTEYYKKIEEIFGSYRLTRKQDQALWVYGHSKVKYPDCVTT